MKAIVANLLLGSIFYGLLSNFSVSADSPMEEKKPKATALSAKALIYDDSRLLVPNFELEAHNLIYSLASGNKDHLKHILNFDSWYLNQNTSNLSLITEQFLPQNKRFQIHNSPRGDLVLGFHNTFWNSERKQKYWGLTSIEQWGENKIEGIKLNKLNYTDAAPILPQGTASLTVSGGGKKKLLTKNDLIGEFEDFRGGVAYHEGIDESLTLGLGFFYEDFLSGFSQLTYKPDNFPLRTTVSFKASENGIDLNSHLQLKPSQDFVLNFYSNSQRQKFDLNWGIASGLTLTAEGNTQEEELKAGAKIAFKNEFISFLARAELDNNNDLKWRINSRFGRLQLIHATNLFKSNSEIRYDLGNYSSSFQCAMFFKHQTQEIKNKPEELAIWGWNFYSGQKIDNKHYTWEFELAYGMGSQGQGAMISATAAINSGLFLTIKYEDISLKSDETKIKFELTSK